MVPMPVDGDENTRRYLSTTPLDDVLEESLPASNELLRPFVASTEVDQWQVDKIRELNKPDIDPESINTSGLKTMINAGKNGW